MIRTQKEFTRIFQMEVMTRREILPARQSCQNCLFSARFKVTWMNSDRQTFVTSDLPLEPVSSLVHIWRGQLFSWTGPEYFWEYYAEAQELRQFLEYSKSTGPLVFQCQRMGSENSL